MLNGDTSSALDRKRKRVMGMARDGVNKKIEVEGAGQKVNGFNRWREQWMRLVLALDETHLTAATAKSYLIEQ